MKPVAILLAIFFVVLTSANAQDGRTSACPTISVTGPSGILSPGESLIYSAELKGAIPSNLQFKWKVDKGKIISGQGTTSLTVIYQNPTDPAVGIIATLEIIGLPDGCPSSASETYSFIIDPGPIVVDEFTIAVTKIDKKRLTHLVSKLSENQNAYAYIIEYFPPKTLQRSIDKKLRLTSDYLTRTKKIPKGEFRILTAKSPMARTKYYLIPPGVYIPMP